MAADIVERVLTPGRDVDVGAALKAYAEGLPGGRPGKSHDLVKAVADRSMEVAYPFLLQAARDARRRTVNLGDDWNYSFEDTGNPWRPSVFVQNSRGYGYLCAFELDVRPSSDTLSAFDPGYAVVPGSRFSVEAIQARLDVERRAVDSGFTAGMPDPASVTGIKAASIYLVRPDHGHARAFSGILPGTLRETLASVATGAYSDGRIVVFKPDGTRLKSGGECHTTSTVLDALTQLGRVARDAGGSAAFAARNEEVGSREVVTLCDRGWEIALLEAAAGAVHRDGGSPGDDTFLAVQAAWLQDVGASVARLHGDLVEARGILEGRGHVSREDAYACNDGDDRMWVTDGPDGVKDCYVADRDGLYLVRQVDDAKGSSLSMARLGDGDQERGTLPPHLALEYGTHAFLGRYRVGRDGSALVLEPPLLSDGGIFALDAMAVTMSSVAACAQDEYGDAAPAP